MVRIGAPSGSVVPPTAAVLTDCAAASGLSEFSACTTLDSVNSGSVADLVSNKAGDLGGKFFAAISWRFRSRFSHNGS